MECVNVLSGLETGDAAVREVMQTLCDRSPEGDPFWFFVFASGHSEETMVSLTRHLRMRHPEAEILGCSSEGVVGEGRELERRPGLSLFGAWAPDARAIPLYLTQEMMEENPAWADNLFHDDLDVSSLLVLADPFSVDPNRFLEGIEERDSFLPVIGGLASGATRPGDCLLVKGSEVFREGLVALGLAGNIVAEPMVSQGCRPIGEHYVVTKAEANKVQALRGQSAFDVLREMAGELPLEDRQLLHQGVFVGQAVDEYQSTYGRGDFLVRGLMGADPKDGALAIAGRVRPGTTVQFHVRDAASADEDLRLLLEERSEQSFTGALMFTCNGRGTRMWDMPGHDAGLVDRIFPDLPVGGLFCAGEFGPLGKRNFLHGFTASMAFFRPRE